jgi:hypothetical protein
VARLLPSVGTVVLKKKTPSTGRRGLSERKRRRFGINFLTNYTEFYTVVKSIYDFFVTIDVRIDKSPAPRDTDATLVQSTSNKPIVPVPR